MSTAIYDRVRLSAVATGTAGSQFYIANQQSPEKRKGMNIHSPFLFLFLFFFPFHNFVNSQLIINGEIAYEWREQPACNIMTRNLGLYLEEFDRGKAKGKENSGRNGGTSQFLNGFWDIKEED